MAPLSLVSLVAPVRTLLSGSQAARPPIGDAQMDAALAALARYRDAGQPLSAELLPYWFALLPDLVHADSGGEGQDPLGAAPLLPALDAPCQAALRRPGRLFSATPVWAWTFLAWAEALGATPRAAVLPAAVACECLAAGCDQLDTADGLIGDPLRAEERAAALAAGRALLRRAEELLEGLALPTERRAGARALLRQALGRALEGQRQDVALRQAPAASPEVLVAVLQRRSGTLVAATCQCAAWLSGSPWPTVALAGRFGVALGCAAQLDDDLADQEEDARTGRKTLPLLLARQYRADPEVVAATTWVLRHCFLQEAVDALARLPLAYREDAAVWALVPASLRAA